MEKLNLTREEKELILNALNEFWHEKNARLQSVYIGDIEKKNLEGLRNKASKLIKKINKS